MMRINFEAISQLEKVQSESEFNDILRQIGINQPCLLNLIANSYSFATTQQYQYEKKQQMLNKVLQLIYRIPSLQTSKAQFISSFDSQVNSLSCYSSQRLNPSFTKTETQKLSSFLKSQILPYYELYEFLLDQNPDFVLECMEYNPVVEIREEPASKGSVVEVETVDILKDFVGQRVPKQEKKQGKKK